MWADQYAVAESSLLSKRYDPYVMGRGCSVGQLYIELTGNRACADSIRSDGDPTLASETRVRQARC